MRSQVVRGFIIMCLVVLWCATPGHSQFEWDRRRADEPLPNPSMVRVPRERALEIVREVLANYGLEVQSVDCDETRALCTVQTETKVFTRGIVADSQFRHVADIPAPSVRNITRGRVTLRVEIEPNRPGVTSVGVYGTFQGLAEGAVGSQWITGASRGRYEDRLLRAVVNVANGLPMPDAPPAAREQEPTDDQPVRPGVRDTP